MDLRLGNCLDVLPTLPDASIDCVVTDPAYESLNKWREMGTTARMGGHYDPAKRDETRWFPTLSNTDIPALVYECWRVLKPDTHCYIMADFDTLPILREAALGRGLFQHMAPLIWNKDIPGMGYHYRRSFEFIFLLDKGKNRRLNDLTVPDVLTIRPPLGAERTFPTQKPVKLMEILIKQSTQPGEVVLDPFMGSGSTGIACFNTGRRFLGIEIHPRHFEVAQQRINAAGEQLALPLGEG